MAYEPTLWQDGDIVTSQKLNKIEQGIVDTNGALIIEINNLPEGIEFDNYTFANTTLNKTAEEIVQAFNAGKNIYLQIPFNEVSTFYCALISLNQTYYQNEIYLNLAFTGQKPSEMIMYGSDLDSDSNPILIFEGILNAVSTINITRSEDTYQTDVAFDDIYMSISIVRTQPTVRYWDQESGTIYFGELLSINRTSLTAEIKFNSSLINNGQSMNFIAETSFGRLSYQPGAQ